MSGIKRWDIDCHSMEWMEIEDGDMVKFSDHAAEIARLRAELEKSAKAALDAVALACEKEREADALRVKADRYDWIRRNAVLDGANGDQFDSEIDEAMGADA